MPQLCTSCPRYCRVSREQGERGFCHSPAEFRVARIALHPWEEPCISGQNGSGTVFFCGCNLRCVYCQNKDISQGDTGYQIGDEALVKEILALQDAGAANINLVTPTHYTKRLVPLLTELRKQLHIPVVYNCGGYEEVNALKSLEGLIDIYLPDCKYFDPVRAKNYSSVPDYFDICQKSIAEMIRQVGKPTFSEDGLMKSGVIVRHLVLPGGRNDSIRILRELESVFGHEAFLLSLMNQYTPDFAKDAPFQELHRRVTTFEYQSVLEVAQELNFSGFSQSRVSATASYTPNFHEERP